MSEAARLEQGLATTERQPFEVAEVLRGCIEGYRLAFAGRTFELDLPDGPVTVEGSPDLLAQLLDKLVDNANDFAAPGTPIRIRLERTEDEALLSVINLGVSLPEGAIACSPRWCRSGPARRRGVRTSGSACISRA
jgi:signal transduction histidine kinase